jgi:hypothetical protein
MKKTLCSVPGDCVAIVLDALGGSAGDWWVSPDGSQWLYALHALRKGRLRPSVCNDSIWSLPLGVVSVGDVACFWARVYDSSLDITRHSGPAWVRFHA